MTTITKSQAPRGKLTYEPGIPTMPSVPFPLFRFSPLTGYFADFDRLFNQFWQEPTKFEYPLWTPEIEVFKRDGELVIHADLPGLKKSDVKIEIEQNTLVLSGERKEEHKEEGEKFYRSERSYGSFFRTMPLPETAETDKVKARFEDGVLEVIVPIKEEPVPPRKLVEIK